MQEKLLADRELQPQRAAAAEQDLISVFFRRGQRRGETQRAVKVPCAHAFAHGDAAQPAGQRTSGGGVQQRFQQG